MTTRPATRQPQHRRTWPYLREVDHVPTLSLRRADLRAQTMSTRFPPTSSAARHHRSPKPWHPAATAFAPPALAEIQGGSPDQFASVVHNHGTRSRPGVPFRPATAEFQPRMRLKRSRRRASRNQPIPLLGQLREGFVIRYHRRGDRTIHHLAPLSKRRRSQFLQRAASAPADSCVYFLPNRREVRRKSGADIVVATISFVIKRHRECVAARGQGIPRPRPGTGPSRCPPPAGALALRLPQDAERRVGRWLSATLLFVAESAGFVSGEIVEQAALGGDPDITAGRSMTPRNTEYNMVVGPQITPEVAHGEEGERPDADQPKDAVSWVHFR